uniref:Si:dkey-288a3.2 n=1 Tax=Cyprinus carpio carpio TaxID=630221 RepID=A0A9J8CWM0_CYPCA
MYVMVLIHFNLFFNFFFFNIIIEYKLDILDVALICGFYICSVLAGSLTLTDIILAYKQSCEKHHVEPNPKALEQLKQITCVTDRARCFDLSGEWLDYCSCESLEEILKSVQFDFISLQGAELEQNGASSLLDMFLYYESATHLDVSSNSGMGFSGWLSLSHLLRQSGCLWRLDACNMPMVDYAAQALSKALLTSRLTVLHLENTCLSGKPLFTLGMPSTHHPLEVHAI